jgi:glycosyltransferase involved in cell wall biosynthesis
LFVCPSRREPLSLVLLEAFDAGLPVIGSTALGPRELIEQYGGELFPIDDAAALAAMLRRHSAAPHQRYRPDLSAHYIKNVSPAIIGVYSTLIAERARASYA